YWQNDDLHRNGALRLSYIPDWVYGLQLKKETYEDFPYDTNDTYDFLLRLGPVDNLDKLYFKGRIPLFTALLDHPNHDS
ncbi:hypothetical protein ABTN55_21120, partial [Acinetobacter baumannii]